MDSPRDFWNYFFDTLRVLDQRLEVLGVEVPGRDLPVHRTFKEQLTQTLANPVLDDTTDRHKSQEFNGGEHV